MTLPAALSDVRLIHPGGPITSPSRSLGPRVISVLLARQKRLVEQGGVEPPKPVGRLVYSQGISPMNAAPNSGADGESRPHNLPLTRRLLCPLSYISLSGTPGQALARTAGSVELLSRAHRETPPRCFTQSTLLKSTSPGRKKAPGGSNQPGLLFRASLEGSMREPSETMFG